MTRRLTLRSIISVVLLAALLSPTAVFAGNGKKHFTRGMKHEAAEEWDKAAEAFALAVSENPKNPEYQLHYKRALFMASQMYIKVGVALAKEKDYVGAYNAFRKAYAFDPVNELAKNEMERMIRLEEESQKPAKKDGGGSGSEKSSPEQQTPQFETINVGPYPSGIEVQTLIKDLAKSLDLNVIFDSESFRPGQRTMINIELANVTAARALDYIFLQQNLFFQKVGPRTIVVASGNQRQKFQQLVLKTFYLANASPKDVQKVVQTAIPAQPGRTPTITLIDEPTNSITIRDTEENIRLIGSLIKSLDKDRAEVVMDVAIYEVTKADLLRLGNQIGDQTQLTQLGGTTRGIIGANAGKQIFGNLISPSSPIPTAFGVGWAIPAANLQAFQSRGNTKLLASTQIHAFNNEDSTARIGQRVPVRSASIAPVFGGSNNQTTNNFVGDVFQYEQVGLTLKFKPLVFPNQDVQVSMKIESKDVVAGGTAQNPTFSERTIEGTARVQNNKTLLLASVAQDVQSDTRSGLPILGLIPVLGRLFTAPSNENRQVDIVIAITPRVIRVPSITSEDEAERPTGSLAVPTSGSLESLVMQEDMDERLAAARRLGNSTQVQLPDQPVDTSASAASGDSDKPAAPAPDSAALKSVSGDAGTTASVRPIESNGVKNLQAAPVESKAVPEQKSNSAPASQNGELQAIGPTASVSLVPVLPAMRKGEKTRIAVVVKSGADFRSAVLGLRYNPFNVAVRSVSFGDVFNESVRGKDVAPFINQDGKTYVALSTPKDLPESKDGILAYIEVEALADGQFTLGFDSDITAFLTSSGKSFAVKF